MYKGPYGIQIFVTIILCITLIITGFCLLFSIENIISNDMEWEEIVSEILK